MEKQSVIVQAKERAFLYRKTREFFDNRGYLEVETPTLSPDLIPEPTIDCFATTFINEFAGSRELYLVPSPEVFIKKLIASGFGSVYEISKCFRNCEQLGNIHNPEFTMLEYYTVGQDEEYSIKLTLEYLQGLVFPDYGRPVWLDSEPLIMSVRDAVLEHCGLDLDEYQSSGALRKAAVETLGLHIPGPEPWDDTFNRIFCTFVEPAIPTDRIVIFTDYPQQIDCLAKRNGNWRRRWEMYICEVEIANCYLEETDPETVRSYYSKEQARLVELRNQNGRPIPDADPSFADYFSSFPLCSGVAIGMDRLLMVLTGRKSIQETLLFPFNA